MNPEYNVLYITLLSVPEGLGNIYLVHGGLSVPLEETISICVEALNDNPDSQPYFPEDVFIELMHGATSMVEFSFNNIIYKHIDGVVMCFTTWTRAGQHLCWIP